MFVQIASGDEGWFVSLQRIPFSPGSPEIIIGGLKARGDGKSRSNPTERLQEHKADQDPQTEGQEGMPS